MSTTVAYTNEEISSFVEALEQLNDDRDSRRKARRLLVQEKGPHDVYAQLLRPWDPPFLYGRRDRDGGEFQRRQEGPHLGLGPGTRHPWSTIQVDVSKARGNQKDLRSAHTRWNYVRVVALSARRMVRLQTEVERFSAHRGGQLARRRYVPTGNPNEWGDGQLDADLQRRFDPFWR
jgi:hypothetical protein